LATSGACANTQKDRVDLHKYKELIEKSRELGFKLIKTFEKLLKNLVN
jgi:hypothetical protein